MENGNEGIIYEFDKNLAEKVRFTESLWEGKVYYHIRIYTRSNMNGQSVWLPTKKGLSFSKEQLAPFLEGVVYLGKFLEQEEKKEKFKELKNTVENA